MLLTLYDYNDVFYYHTALGSKNTSLKKYLQNVFSRKFSWCMEQSFQHNVQRGCRCNQLFIYQTLSSVTTNWLTDVERSAPYVYNAHRQQTFGLTSTLYVKSYRTALRDDISDGLNNCEYLCLRFQLFHQCCHRLTVTIVVLINTFLRRKRLSNTRSFA